MKRRKLDSPIDSTQFPDTGSNMLFGWMKHIFEKSKKSVVNVNVQFLPSRRAFEMNNEPLPILELKAVVVVVAKYTYFIY